MLESEWKKKSCRKERNIIPITSGLSESLFWLRILNDSQNLKPPR